MRLRRLLLIFCLFWLSGCRPASVPPAAITATPFLPLPPTATLIGVPVTASGAISTPAPDLAIEHWWGLDFSIEAQPVRVGFDLDDGSPLAIRFRTGWPCEYADHRACAGIYSTGSAPVLLLTVHSGLWGEAEPLRAHLEGMGINRAALPLEQVRQNLLDLSGLPVTMEQGENKVSDLKVRAAVRVPPDLLDRYFALQIPDALQLAAGLESDFADALDDPLVIIETCGWRHPEEAWLPGISDTSASIYLLAIGQDE